MSTINKSMDYSAKPLPLITSNVKPSQPPNLSQNFQSISTQMARDKLVLNYAMTITGEYRLRIVITINKTVNSKCDKRRDLERMITYS